jgi:hypothetical protein
LHFTLDVSRLRLAKEMSRYYAAEAIKRSPKLERLARAAMASTISLHDRLNVLASGGKPAIEQ